MAKLVIRHDLHATAIRVRVATVMLGPRAPAVTGLIRHDRRVMGIHVPHVAAATVLTRHDRRVMGTDHTLRALGVTATVLVARRAPVVTVRIPLVRPVMETALALTGRAVIAPMATAHAGTGNPRAVSVVRSVRR